MTSVPELYKEKLFLGEADEGEKEFLRRAGFSASEEAAARASINRSNKEFIQKYPIETLISSHDARSEGKTKRERKTPALTSFAWVCTAGAVMLCVLALHVNSTAFDTRTEIAAQTERVKGAEPHIFVYKKTNDIEALLLSNNAVVHEKDVLQVTYSAGDAEYGAIISVDGNGIITRHFPDTGDKTAKLTAGGETPLEFAYQLDDAPDFERFIFISGNAPVSLVKLQAAFGALREPEKIKTLAPGEYLPRDCKTAEVLLLKDDTK